MPFSGFGAQTDHFSFADTNIKLINSTKEPRAKNRADALDDVGDLNAFTHFGSTTIYDIECEYELVGGSTATLNLNTIPLGALDDATGLASLGAEVTTSNGNTPRIKIKGVLGATGLDDTATWTLPDLSITGEKLAQPIGYTVAAGAPLTGSGFSFDLDLAEETDGLGVPVMHSISGPNPAKVSASGTAVTAAGGWTLTLSGLSATKAPGVAEPQAAYGDWSAEAEVLIARDAAV